MNEYKISIVGTMTRDLPVLAANEDAAIKAISWHRVWGDHEGEDGDVCDRLDTDMPMQVTAVEFVREIPPPPPRPGLYNEAIMYGLVNLITPYVSETLASYDGSPDHAYRRVYAEVGRLVQMWQDMGVKAALNAPSPNELDAERAKLALGGVHTPDADGEANG
jgi:hypothetical protein